MSPRKLIRPGREQRIRYAVSLGLIFAFGANAAQQKPDTFLVEYQAFRPSLYFGPHSMGPKTALFTAIQSEQQWRELWSRIDMDRHRPQHIDFTRKTLLVAALGTKPTGGYSVSINSVVESATRITVNVIALRPKNCGSVLSGVTLTATSPIAFVLIPKTVKPVEFSTREAEDACGQEGVSAGAGRGS